MDLRPELLPPIVDAQRIQEIGDEIERIADLACSGDPRATAQALASFNARTGHAYVIADFMDFDEWRDLEDFAREAARPAWPKVADISREDLVAVVERIMAADAETDYYVLLLRANTPHPRVTDLIFYPTEELADASAESIVDAALGYRAIAL